MWDREDYNVFYPLFGNRVCFMAGAGTAPTAAERRAAKAEAAAAEARRVEAARLLAEQAAAEAYRVAHTIPVAPSRDDVTFRGIMNKESLYGRSIQRQPDPSAEVRKINAMNVLEPYKGKLSTFITESKDKGMSQGEIDKIIGDAGYDVESVAKNYVSNKIFELYAEPDTYDVTNFLKDNPEYGSTYSRTKGWTKDNGKAVITRIKELIGEYPELKDRFAKYKVGKNYDINKLVEDNPELKDRLEEYKEKIGEYNGNVNIRRIIGERPEAPVSISKKITPLELDRLIKANPELKNKLEPYKIVDDVTRYYDIERFKDESDENRNTLERYKIPEVKHNPAQPIYDVNKFVADYPSLADKFDKYKIEGATVEEYGQVYDIRKLISENPEMESVLADYVTKETTELGEEIVKDKATYDYKKLLSENKDVLDKYKIDKRINIGKVVKGLTETGMSKDSVSELLKNAGYDINQAFILSAVEKYKVEGGYNISEFIDNYMSGVVDRDGNSLGFVQPENIPSIQDVQSVVDDLNKVGFGVNNPYYLRNHISQLSSIITTPQTFKELLLKDPYVLLKENAEEILSVLPEGQRPIKYNDPYREQRVEEWQAIIDKGYTPGNASEYGQYETTKLLLTAYLNNPTDQWLMPNGDAKPLTAEDLAAQELITSWTDPVTGEVHQLGFALQPGITHIEEKGWKLVNLPKAEFVDQTIINDPNYHYTEVQTAAIPTGSSIAIFNAGVNPLTGTYLEPSASVVKDSRIVDALLKSGRYNQAIQTMLTAVGPLQPPSVAMGTGWSSGGYGKEAPASEGETTGKDAFGNPIGTVYTQNDIGLQNFQTPLGVTGYVDSSGNPQVTGAVGIGYALSHPSVLANAKVAGYGQLSADDVQDIVELNEANQSENAGSKIGAMRIGANEEAISNIIKAATPINTTLLTDALSKSPNNPAQYLANKGFTKAASQVSGAVRDESTNQWRMKTSADITKAMQMLADGVQQQTLAQEQIVELHRIQAEENAKLNARDIEYGLDKVEGHVPRPSTVEALMAKEGYTKDSQGNWQQSIPIAMKWGVVGTAKRDDGTVVDKYGFVSNFPVVDGVLKENSYISASGEPKVAFKYAISPLADTERNILIVDKDWLANKTDKITENWITWGEFSDAVSQSRVGLPLTDAQKLEKADKAATAVREYLAKKDVWDKKESERNLLLADTVAGFQPKDIGVEPKLDWSVFSGMGSGTQTAIQVLAPYFKAGDAGILKAIDRWEEQTQNPEFQAWYQSDQKAPMPINLDYVIRGTQPATTDGQIQRVDNLPFQQYISPEIYTADQETYEILGGSEGLKTVFQVDVPDGNTQTAITIQWVRDGKVISERTYSLSSQKGQEALAYVEKGSSGKSPIVAKEPTLLINQAAQPSPTEKPPLVTPPPEPMGGVVGDNITAPPPTVLEGQFYLSDNISGKGGGLYYKWNGNEFALLRNNENKDDRKPVSLLVRKPGGDWENRSIDQLNNLTIDKYQSDIMGIDFGLKYLNANGWGKETGLQVIGYDKDGNEITQIDNGLGVTLISESNLPNQQRKLSLDKVLKQDKDTGEITLADGVDKSGVTIFMYGYEGCPYCKTELDAIRSGLSNKYGWNGDIKVYYLDVYNNLDPRILNLLQSGRMDGDTTLGLPRDSAFRNVRLDVPWNVVFINGVKEATGKPQFLDGEISAIADRANIKPYSGTGSDGKVIVYPELLAVPNKLPSGLFPIAPSGTGTYTYGTNELGKPLMDRPKATYIVEDTSSALPNQKRFVELPNIIRATKVGDKKFNYELTGEAKDRRGLVIFEFSQPPQGCRYCAKQDAYVNNLMNSIIGWGNDRFTLYKANTQDITGVISSIVPGTGPENKQGTPTNVVFYIDDNGVQTYVGTYNAFTSSDNILANLVSKYGIQKREGTGSDGKITIYGKPTFVASTDVAQPPAVQLKTPTPRVLNWFEKAVSDISDLVSVPYYSYKPTIEPSKMTDKERQTETANIMRGLSFSAGAPLTSVLADSPGIKGITPNLYNPETDDLQPSVFPSIFQPVVRAINTANHQVYGVEAEKQGKSSVGWPSAFATALKKENMQSIAVELNKTSLKEPVIDIDAVLNDENIPQSVRANASVALSAGLSPIRTNAMLVNILKSSNINPDIYMVSEADKISEIVMKNIRPEDLLPFKAQSEPDVTYPGGAYFKTVLNLSDLAVLMAAPRIISSINSSITGTGGVGTLAGIKGAYSTLCVGNSCAVPIANASLPFIYQLIPALRPLVESGGKIGEVVVKTDDGKEEPLTIQPITDNKSTSQLPLSANLLPVSVPSEETSLKPPVTAPDIGAFKGGEVPANLVPSNLSWIKIDANGIVTAEDKLKTSIFVIDSKNNFGNNKDNWHTQNIGIRGGSYGQCAGGQCPVDDQLTYISIVNAVKSSNLDINAYKPVSLPPTTSISPLGTTQTTAITTPSTTADVSPVGIPVSKPKGMTDTEYVSYMERLANSTKEIGGDKKWADDVLAVIKSNPNVVEAARLISVIPMPVYTYKTPEPKAEEAREYVPQVPYTPQSAEYEFNQRMRVIQNKLDNKIELEEGEKKLQELANTYVGTQRRQPNYYTIMNEWSKWEKSTTPLPPSLPTIDKFFGTFNWGISARPEGVVSKQVADAAKAQEEHIKNLNLLRLTDKYPDLHKAYGIPMSTGLIKIDLTPDQLNELTVALGFRDSTKTFPTGHPLAGTRYIPFESLANRLGIMKAQELYQEAGRKFYETHKGDIEPKMPTSPRYATQKEIIAQKEAIVKPKVEYSTAVVNAYKPGQFSIFGKPTDEDIYWYNLSQRFLGQDPKRDSPNWNSIYDVAKSEGMLPVVAAEEEGGVAMAATDDTSGYPRLTQTDVATISQEPQLPSVTQLIMGRYPTVDKFVGKTDMFAAPPEPEKLWYEGGTAMGPYPKGTIVMGGVLPPKVNPEMWYLGGTAQGPVPPPLSLGGLSVYVPSQSNIDIFNKQKAYYEEQGRMPSGLVFIGVDENGRPRTISKEQLLEFTDEDQKILTTEGIVVWNKKNSINGPIVSSNILALYGGDGRAFANELIEKGNKPSVVKSWLSTVYEQETVKDIMDTLPKDGELPDSEYLQKVYIPSFYGFFAQRLRGSNDIEVQTKIKAYDEALKYAEEHPNDPRVKYGFSTYLAASQIDPVAKDTEQAMQISQAWSTELGHYGQELHKVVEPANVVVQSVMASLGNAGTITPFGKVSLEGTDDRLISPITFYKDTKTGEMKADWVMRGRTIDADTQWADVAIQWINERFPKKEAEELVAKLEKLKATGEIGSKVGFGWNNFVGSAETLVWTSYAFFEMFKAGAGIIPITVLKVGQGIAQGDVAKAAEDIAVNGGGMVLFPGQWMGEKISDIGRGNVPKIVGESAGLGISFVITPHALFNLGLRVGKLAYLRGRGLTIGDVLDPRFMSKETGVPMAKLPKSFQELVGVLTEAKLSSVYRGMGTAEQRAWVMERLTPEAQVYFKSVNRIIDIAPKAKINYNHIAKAGDVDFTQGCERITVVKAAQNLKKLLQSWEGKVALGGSLSDFWQMIGIEGRKAGNDIDLYILKDPKTGKFYYTKEFIMDNVNKVLKDGGENVGKDNQGKVRLNGGKGDKLVEVHNYGEIPLYEFGYGQRLIDTPVVVDGISMTDIRNQIYRRGKEVERPAVGEEFAGYVGPKYAGREFVRRVKDVGRFLVIAKMLADDLRLEGKGELADKIESDLNVLVKGKMGKPLDVAVGRGVVTAEDFIKLVGEVQDLALRVGGLKDGSKLTPKEQQAVWARVQAGETTKKFLENAQKQGFSGLITKELVNDIASSIAKYFDQLPQKATKKATDEAAESLRQSFERTKSKYGNVKGLNDSLDAVYNDTIKIKTVDRVIKFYEPKDVTDLFTQNDKSIWFVDRIRSGLTKESRDVWDAKFMLAQFLYDLSQGLKLNNAKTIDLNKLFPDKYTPEQSARILKVLQKHGDDIYLGGTVGDVLQMEGVDLPDVIKPKKDVDISISRDSKVGAYQLAMEIMESLVKPGDKILSTKQTLKDGTLIDELVGFDAKDGAQIFATVDKRGFTIEKVTPEGNVEMFDGVYRGHFKNDMLLDEWASKKQFVTIDGVRVADLRNQILDRATILLIPAAEFRFFATGVQQRGMAGTFGQMSETALTGEITGVKAYRGIKDWQRFEFENKYLIDELKKQGLIDEAVFKTLNDLMEISKEAEKTTFYEGYGGKGTLPNVYLGEGAILGRPEVVGEVPPEPQIIATPQSNLANIFELLGIENSGELAQKAKDNSLDKDSVGLIAKRLGVDSALLSKEFKNTDGSTSTVWDVLGKIDNVNTMVKLVKGRLSANDIRKLTSDKSAVKWQKNLVENQKQTKIGVYSDLVNILNDRNIGDEQRLVNLINVAIDQVELRNKILDISNGVYTLDQMSKFIKNTYSSQVWGERIRILSESFEIVGDAVGKSTVETFDNVKPVIVNALKDMGDVIPLLGKPMVDLAKATGNTAQAVARSEAIKIMGESFSIVNDAMRTATKETWLNVKPVVANALKDMKDTLPMVREALADYYRMGSDTAKVIARSEAVRIIGESLGIVGDAVRNSTKETWDNVKPLILNSIKDMQETLPMVADAMVELGRYSANKAQLIARSEAVRIMGDSLAIVKEAVESSTKETYANIKPLVLNSVKDMRDTLPMVAESMSDLGKWTADRARIIANSEAVKLMSDSFGIFNDAIATSSKETYDNVKPVLVNALKDMSDTLPDIADAVADLAKITGNTARAMARSEAIRIMGESLSIVGDALNTSTRETWDNVKPLVVNAMKDMRDTLPMVRESIDELAKYSADVAKAIARSEAVRLMGDSFSIFGEAVRTSSKETYDNVKPLMLNALKDMKDTLPMVVDSMNDLAKATGRTAQYIARSEAVRIMGEAIDIASQSIRDSSKETWDNIKPLVINSVKDMCDTFPMVIDVMSDVTKDGIRLAKVLGKTEMVRIMGESFTIFNEAIRTSYKESWENTKPVILNAIKDLKDTLPMVGEVIGDTAKSGVETARILARSNAVKYMIETLDIVRDAVRDSSRETYDNLKPFIEDRLTDLRETWPMVMEVMGDWATYSKEVPTAVVKNLKVFNDKFIVQPYVKIHDIFLREDMVRRMYALESLVRPLPPYEVYKAMLIEYAKRQYLIERLGKLPEKGVEVKAEKTVVEPVGIITINSNPEIKMNTYFEGSKISLRQGDGKVDVLIDKDGIVRTWYSAKGELVESIVDGRKIKIIIDNSPEAVYGAFQGLTDVYTLGKVAEIANDPVRVRAYMAHEIAHDNYLSLDKVGQERINDVFIKDPILNQYLREFASTLYGDSFVMGDNKTAGETYLSAHSVDKLRNSFVDDGYKGYKDRRSAVINFKGTDYEVFIAPLITEMLSYSSPLEIGQSVFDKVADYGRGLRNGVDPRYDVIQKIYDYIKSSPEVYATLSNVLKRETGIEDLLVKSVQGMVLAKDILAKELAATAPKIEPMTLGEKRTAESLVIETLPKVEITRTPTLMERARAIRGERKKAKVTMGEPSARMKVPSSVTVPFTSKEKIAYESILGDTHADLSQVKKILRRSEVIDSEANLAQGTKFYNTGDLATKGKASWRTLEFMKKLSDSAPSKNSVVGIVGGNHDIRMVAVAKRAKELGINTVDEFKKVTNAKDKALFDNYVKYGGDIGTAIKLGNDPVMLKWLSDLPAMILTDSNDLIVHVNNADFYKKYGNTIKEVNENIRKAMETVDGAYQVSKDMLSDKPWTEKEVNDLLATYGGKRVIHGHIPVKEITTYFNGKAVNVDTGLKKLMVLQGEPLRATLTKYLTPSEMQNPYRIIHVTRDARNMRRAAEAGKPLVPGYGYDDNLNLVKLPQNEIYFSGQAALNHARDMATGEMGIDPAIVVFDVMPDEFYKLFRHVNRYETFPEGTGLKIGDTRFWGGVEPTAYVLDEFVSIPTGKPTEGFIGLLDDNGKMVDIPSYDSRTGERISVLNFASPKAIEFGVKPPTRAQIRRDNWVAFREGLKDILYPRIPGEVIVSGQYSPLPADWMVFGRRTLEYKQYNPTPQEKVSRQEFATGFANNVTDKLKEQYASVGRTLTPNESSQISNVVNEKITKMFDDIDKSGTELGDVRFVDGQSKLKEYAKRELKNIENDVFKKEVLPKELIDKMADDIVRKTSDSYRSEYAVITVKPSIGLRTTKIGETPLMETTKPLTSIWTTETEIPTIPLTEEVISEIGTTPITGETPITTPTGITSTPSPTETLTTSPTLTSTVTETPSLTTPLRERTTTGIPTTPPITTLIPPTKPTKTIIPPPVLEKFKNKKGEYEGLIAWKQGFVYRIWYAPWSQKDMLVTRKPVEGISYHKGIRSAYDSIRRRGGYIPPVLERDMGIYKVTVRTMKDQYKPELVFTRDIKDVYKGKKRKPIAKAPSTRIVRF